jgi:hypothetical protein
MKPTKRANRILLAISKNLPLESYAAKSAVILSGTELIESGQKEVESIPVDPKKEYIQEIPLYNKKNHFRRLKRAYASGGINAVKKYLTPYVKEEYREKLFSGLDAEL